MTTLAVMVFLTLTAIAVLHVVWSFGVYWPAGNERDLTSLVVGQNGRARMPGPAECLLAAAAIFAAAVVALALNRLVSVPGPSGLVILIGALVTAVFAVRGVAAYVPAWRVRFSEEPFATMDRNWYGPLCLLLAIAFLFILIDRVMSSP